MLLKMKKLLLYFALLSSLYTSAQGVKISAMPTLTDQASINASWIPVVYNLVNYKVNPSLFNQDRIDSIINNWPASALYRFGKSSEDETAGENRFFNLGDYTFGIGTYHGDVFAFQQGTFTASVIDPADNTTVSQVYTFANAASSNTNLASVYKTSHFAKYITYSDASLSRLELMLGANPSLRITGLGTATTANVLYFNNLNGEVTYGAAPSSGGSGGIQSIEGTNGTVVVNDSIVKLGTNPLIENTVIDGDNFYFRFTDTRVQEDLGASIVAANDLTLGADGNTFTITGSTQINAITTTNWQAGSVVRLIFTGTPVVKHNTAGGASTAVLQLSGAVDYTAAINDVLTIVYDGTDWHEASRKLSTSGGGSLRFGVTGEDVTATANRAFSLGSGFLFNISGTHSTSGSMWLIANAGTGTALGITNNGGSSTATFQNSGNGNVVTATAASGRAISGTSTGSLAAAFTVTPASTNTTVNVLEITRSTSGTAATDMAGALQFTMEVNLDGVSTALSNKLISMWTDAANATRTSKFIIQGVTGAVNTDIIEFLGGGNVRQLVTGKGYGLKSPDGATWYITVNNSGVLSTSTSAP
jgi:hypothetical protein